MDVLSWLWWVVSTALSLAWTIIWFLLGGWVSTFAQLAVVLLIVFGMKYGWRQAPFELWSKISSFGRFAWAWIRAKDPGQVQVRTEVREVVRTVRVKELGDVNLSSLLSVLLFAGMGLLVAL